MLFFLYSLIVNLTFVGTMGLYKYSVTFSVGGSLGQLPLGPVLLLYVLHFNLSFSSFSFRFFSFFFLPPIFCSLVRPLLVGSFSCFSHTGLRHRWLHSVGFLPRLVRRFDALQNSLITFHLILVSIRSLACSLNLQIRTKQERVEDDE